LNVLLAWKRLNFSLFSLVLFCSFLASGIGAFFLSGPWAPSGLIGQHQGWITAVTFSPDGKKIAAGGSNGSVSIWNATTLERLSTFSCHEGGICSIRYDLQSAQFISAGVDGTVALVDVNNGNITKKNAHTRSVTQAFFGNNDSCIITAGLDSTVKVWDRTTFENISSWEELALEDADGFVPFPAVPYWPVVRVSPDTTLVALSDNSCFAWVGDLRSSTEKPKKISKHSGFVLFCEFSGDSKYIATGGEDPDIFVQDVKNMNTHMAKLGNEGAYALCCEFNCHSDLIAVGSSDSKIRIFNVAARSLKSVFDGHAGPVSAIHFLGDGRRLVSCGKDNLARVWDVRSGANLQTILGAYGRIYDAVPSKSGDRFVLIEHTAELLNVEEDRAGNYPVRVWHRRYPEWWWGHTYRIEVWVTFTLGLTWLWCVLRKNRRA